MIIKPHHTEFHHLLGGKASALAKLFKVADFSVPAWFAVTDILNPNDILSQADALSTTLYAVRSSAHGEDGSEHSFAGQYDSFLYVKKEDLLEKIEAVFRSSHSDHLASYRDSKNTDGISYSRDEHQVTAIVQKMLTPDVSGVAFSADPVSGDRNISIISALWGTGSALVSGEENADTWKMKEGTIIEEIIADKTHQHIAGTENNEGTRGIVNTKDKISAPCMNHDMISQVAKLANDCEAHFGYPQDIEWAFEDKKLYLLQSRPITTLNKEPEATSPLTVWDNSNIAESYSGITSPLTFTFAERVYEHVYREFCILLSVPKKRVKKHTAVFSKMLGHIHGNVYYNLNSWYHVLAMLPGFSINRGFMEQMMGVKIPMPDEVINDIIKHTKTNKLYDGLSMMRMLFGLIKNQLRLDKNITRFYERLNTALNAPDIPLEQMSSNDLITHYQDLEAKLLKCWDAPLVNDFYAMIYYGILKSLCEKWLGDASLQNTLLLDSGDIISADPPKRIVEMATIVRDDPQLKTLLSSELSYHEKMKKITTYPKLHEPLNAYLEKFGDRCLEELKLESYSVRDNASSLLASISAMSNMPKNEPIQKLVTEKDAANDNPINQLSRIKRKVFNWVLKNARNRVRDRENLRFERTLLFGRVRQIMIHLGEKLAKKNQIPQARDIFHLHLTEAISGKDTDYRDIITDRQREELRFRELPSPPDRFHTVAPIEEYDHFQSVLPYKAPDGDNLSGTGACPGIVRGIIRVVLNPCDASLKEGEILVAQQTDPGWVVLFPAASGLLVERGSLLSHSAIVARELNLPCVVSIPDVTRILKNGDLVEMNGKTGTVTIIKK